MQLDPELFLDVASRVQRLKMYPYFDVAHYALMCMAVRDDLATGATLFSRKHPLSCWLSSMLMCFAGSFLSNLLLGEPVITPFKRHDDIILASIVWYLVFYSPFDLLYKSSRLLPVKLALCLAKEVQRAHKIQIGVNHAAKVYPNAYIVMVMIGTIKGSGSGIMRTMEQLVRGVWVPTGNELLRPSFSTKSCVLVSLLLVLEKKSTIMAAPHELIYLAIVGFLVYFKLSAILLGIVDPLLPFENLFCAIFMGGIWDALSRAIAASRERRATSSVQENGHGPTVDKKEQ